MRSTSPARSKPRGLNRCRRWLPHRQRSLETARRRLRRATAGAPFATSSTPPPRPSASSPPSCIPSSPMQPPGSGRSSAWAIFAKPISKNLQWGGLQPGTKLGELSPLFPRADKETITRMNELEQKNNAAPTGSRFGNLAKPSRDCAAFRGETEPHMLEAPLPGRGSRRRHRRVHHRNRRRARPRKHHAGKPGAKPSAAAKTRDTPTRPPRCGCRRHAPRSARCHEAPGTRTPSTRSTDGHCRSRCASRCCR